MSTDDIQSIALRLLIHFVGDLHQPLHSAERYNSQYLQGDMGGNKFKILKSVPSDPNNLHAVWDSVGYKYPGYNQNPISETKFDELKQSVDKILSQNLDKITASQARDVNIKDWLKENA